MENDYMKEVQILCNLKDAGCCDETIHDFLNNEANIHKQINILRKHRIGLLEDLHVCQKRIECLDYLIYTLKKSHHTHL